MTPKQPTERQQYWLSHIQACDKTDLSYRAYADQHGFSPRALYDAKKALVRDGFLSGKTKSRFQQVQIERSASPVHAAVQTHCLITLPNGISLEWPLASNPDSLATILVVVGAQS